ncbi:MAG TPA: hypothetical protein VJK54_07565 [Chthoniobacterales bacterium]|nr:hypothetical protein [Chthoniobacterales bacterium]
MLAYWRKAAEQYQIAIEFGVKATEEEAKENREGAAFLSAAAAENIVGFP